MSALRGTGPMLLALIAGGTRLAAQRLRLEGGGTGGIMQLRSDVPSGTLSLRGSVLGAEGRVTLGRVLLEFRYLEGTLQPRVGDANARDVVEGQAVLGIRTFAWLTLMGGPHVRAFVTGGNTQRWMLWEMSGRVEQVFIGSTVGGYVEFWRTVAADVSVPEAFGHGEGAEVGMRLGGPNGRLRGRLAYRLEHAVLGGGTRVETLDGVVVGLGLALR